MYKHKICLVVCDISSGGAENVILNYLSAMDRTSMELDLISYGESSKKCKNEFEKLGINIFIIPPKKEGFFKSCSKMNELIKKNKYDIVHAHLTEWNCVPMYIAWKNKVKVRISHAHTSKQINNIGMNILLFFQQIANAIFANKFCTCSDASSDYLYPSYLISKDKIVFIPNAIDTDRFRKDINLRKDLRKELNIPNDVFCLGHIGRLTAVKNQKFLLEIFKEIKNIDLNSRLIIAGNGEMKDELIRYAENLRILDSISFLGVREDTPSIYNAIDCFCLPSFSEGFPVVCVEAQACGTPIVVSDAVTDKVLITNCASRLSLQKTPVEWAKHILSFSNSRTVDSIPMEFDIHKSAIIWRRMYESV